MYDVCNYEIKHSQPLLLKEFYDPEGSVSQFTTKFYSVCYRTLADYSVELPVCRQLIEYPLSLTRHQFLISPL